MPGGSLSDMHVLIVGAGPTGLMAAIELARLGVRCRIIDKEFGPSVASKALAIQARTLLYFNRIGIDQHAIEIGTVIRKAQILRGHRPLGEVNFDQLNPNSPILILPQPATELLLIRRLHDEGIVVERDTDLVSVTEGEARASVVLRTKQKESEVSCEWLVACDGAHSSVRNSLQMPFEGESFDESFMLGDVLLDWDGPRDIASFFLDLGEILALFPLPGGAYRIVIGTQGTREPHGPTIADFQVALDKCGQAGRVRNLIWASRFHINQRQVRKYRVNRVFLAGDAAHVHSPVGGQGMNTGIQDVVNLAWKLAIQVQNGSTEQLLNSYEEERKPVARYLLSATGIVTRAAITKSRVIAFARDILVSALLSRRFVQKAIQKGLSEAWINYRRSSIVMDRLGMKVGPRGGDPLELLPTSTRHLLLTSTGKSMIADLVRERHSEMVEIGNIALKPAEGLVLVRPDGYVGLRCSSDDIAAFKTYMNNVANVH